ncbi:MAG: N-acetylglucosamine-6-phosphate deacetylase [Armatimonadota bacterium]
MTDLVIVGGTLVLPDGSLVPGSVAIQNGLVCALGDVEGLGKTTIDASGCYVLPGIIDIHTHGIGYESSASESLYEYAKLEAACGCTSFFPTLFGPPEVSAEHMRRHRSNTNELADLPQVGGFRLESPYLGFTGAGTSRDLAPISKKVTDELLDAGGGHVKIWDVSPELEGAAGLISELSGMGIVCSLAHMRATIEQARAAIDAGARLVTHLFCTFAVPEMTDPGVYPAGVTDLFLVDDRVACEIIADGTHVNPMLIEMTLRCKPDDMTVFVTDSNYGAGLPSGRYELPGGWGLAAIDGPNNGVRLVEREMGLAGSALTPIDSLRNCIRMLGKDISTASRLCSANPARLLGLNKGLLAVGMDADLIVLDEQLELMYTIVRGKVAFARR